MQGYYAAYADQPRRSDQEGTGMIMGPRDVRQWLLPSADVMIETPLDEEGRETMYTVMRWEENFEQGWWTTCYDSEQMDNADFDTFDEAVEFAQKVEERLS